MMTFYKGESLRIEGFAAWEDGESPVNLTGAHIESNLAQVGGAGTLRRRNTVAGGPASDVEAKVTDGPNGGFAVYATPAEVLALAVGGWKFDVVATLVTGTYAGESVTLYYGEIQIAARVTGAAP